MPWYRSPNDRSPENALTREAIETAVNSGNLDPLTPLYPEIGDHSRTAAEILQQKLAVAREQTTSAPPPQLPNSSRDRPLHADQRTQILNRRLADPSTVDRLTEFQAATLLRRHRNRSCFFGFLKTVGILAILGVTGYIVFRTLPANLQLAVQESISFIPALEPEFTPVRSTHADRIPPGAEILILQSRPRELDQLLETQSEIVARLLQPREELLTEEDCEEFARTLPKPAGQSWILNNRNPNRYPEMPDDDGHERRTDTRWESVHRKYQFMLRNLYRDDPLVRIEDIRATIRRTTDEWASTQGSSPSSQALKRWMLGPLLQHLAGIERQVRARMNQDPLADWVNFKTEDFPRMDALIRTQTKRSFPFDPSKMFRAPSRKAILLRSPLGSETIYIDVSQPDNPFLTVIKS